MRHKVSRRKSSREGEGAPVWWLNSLEGAAGDRKTLDEDWWTLATTAECQESIQDMSGSGTLTGFLLDAGSLESQIARQVKL